MSDKRQRALAALERALADRPDNIYEDLCEANRCLVRLRDELIEQSRTGEQRARDCLPRLNAIISVATSAEYPLVGVRKERVRQACDALRDLPQI